MDGVRFMRNRKPYDLTTFIRCYNVFQVIACSAFVYMTHQGGIHFYDAWTCVKGHLGDDGDYQLTLGWLFIILRGIEFSETITFVLRKKNNQISFLHVYHHVSTLLMVWLFIRSGPCELIHPNFYDSNDSIISSLLPFEQRKMICISHQSIPSFM